MLNQEGLPLRADGTVDWSEALRLAKLRPPASSPQELAEELRLINAREQMRIATLTDNGRNLEPLQRERDAADNSRRRQQELEGKQRVEAEAKRIADALEARRLELASVPSEITDRVTAAKKRYDDAVAAIQAKAAEPVHLTDEEALAMHARKTELTARYNSARDASLKPTVASEKF